MSPSSSLTSLTPTGASPACECVRPRRARAAPRGTGRSRAPCRPTALARRSEVARHRPGPGTAWRTGRASALRGECSWRARAPGCVAAPRSRHHGPAGGRAARAVRPRPDATSSPETRSRGSGQGTARDRATARSSARRRRSRVRRWPAADSRRSRGRAATRSRPRRACALPRRRRVPRPWSTAPTTPRPARAHRNPNLDGATGGTPEAPGPVPVEWSRSPLRSSHWS